MSDTKYLPTTEDIEKAAAVLSEILTPTPFHKNNNLSDVYEAEVYLKREDLQIVVHTRSEEHTTRSGLSSPKS